MAYNVKMAEKELQRRFEENNWQELSLTMKCGETVTVVPYCGSTDHIEFYWIESEKVSIPCGDTLEDVAKALCSFENRLAENKRLTGWLKRYILEHKDECPPQWRSDFSDTYKHVFGHRPELPVEQLVKWAQSDSEKAAKYI